eukprot:scaffold6620_cov110-Isochrysis_galbana.AAC.1
MPRRPNLNEWVEDVLRSYGDHQFRMTMRGRIGGAVGPIGPKSYPLGNTKSDTAGPVPTPLPSAKFGRPPPTLAKFSSSTPPTGLGGVKTLECEQLKITGFCVKHTTKELEIAPVPLQ